jgi:hypothetical protein
MVPAFVVITISCELTSSIIATLNYTKTAEGIYGMDMGAHPRRDYEHHGR